jgi:hypothetical protein
MIRPFRIATCVLVGALALSGSLAHAAASVASQADLDNAIAQTMGQEDAQRGAITSLLQRDDVRALAKGHGLDLRRAAAAVGTLDGQELESVSRLAASADLQLSGGDTSISISLVAVLLIVIIVILLTR